MSKKNKMNFLTLVILSLVVVISTIVIIQFSTVWLVKNVVKETVSGIKKGWRESNFFLKGMELSKGDYALRVKHKEQGEFMVTELEGLQTNQDILEINTSWVNFLPGKGDRSFGVELFKDNVSIRKNLGGVFKTFEIGTLKDYEQDFTTHSFEGNKQAFQEKLKHLKANKNNYITYVSKTTKDDDDKEFYFGYRFPHIAVPATVKVDANGREHFVSINEMTKEAWYNEGKFILINDWVTKIKRCIKEKAGSLHEFEINAHLGGVGIGGYLFEVGDSWNYLQNKEQKTLRLNTFLFYRLDVSITANKSVAESLWKLDFSNCVTDQDRKKEAVIQAMQELVNQSSKPHLSVKNNEVSLDGYQDEPQRSKKIMEKQYSIKWLEINPKK